MEALRIGFGGWLFSSPTVELRRAGGLLLFIPSSPAVDLRRTGALLLGPTSALFRAFRESSIPGEPGKSFSNSADS